MENSGKIWETMQTISRNSFYRFAEMEITTTLVVLALKTVSSRHRGINYIANGGKKRAGLTLETLEVDHIYTPVCFASRIAFSRNSR
jgi:hypothetical protein